MEKNDLTNPQKFLSFLGSFWENVFESGKFGAALSDYFSDRLSQLHKDLTSSTNQVSAYSINPFRYETAVSVLVKRSELEDDLVLPRLGDDIYLGEVNGQQPILLGRKNKSKFKYFIQRPDSTKRIHSVALASPTLSGSEVVLVHGVDFELQSEIIAFSENIFLKSGFNPRLEVIDGIEEEVITLWLHHALVDYQDIFKNFGAIFSTETKSSVQYKEVTQRFIELLSGGPSIKAIENFFCSSAGVQLSQEKELIESITELPDKRVIIVTDKNYYEVAPGKKIDERVSVGNTIEKFTPLTTAVRVIDPKTSRDWWKDMSAISVKGMFNLDETGLISFPNELCDLQILEVRDKNGTILPTIRFELLGSDKVVSSFWRKVDSGVVNGVGSFEKFIEEKRKNLSEDEVARVNPAEILSTDIAQNIIIPVFIDLDQVDNINFFLSSIYGSFSDLDGLMPINAFIILFQKLTTSDSFNLGLMSSESVINHEMSQPFDENTVCISSVDGVISDIAYTYAGPPIENNLIATDRVLVKYRSKCTL